MPIYFALYPNALTEEPDDYYAVVQPAQSRDIEDIADRIIEMGSTVTRADILSVLNDRDEAVRAMLLDGDRVNTPLVSLSVSIKGVFNGPHDSFDASRHQFKVSANPRRDLETWVQKNARSQKVEPDRPEPMPQRFIDVTSGELNSLITAGSVVNIEGRRLKFDADDPEQGVFFVADDGTASRAEKIARNTPSELIVVVPDDLPSGNYTLEVRSILPDVNEVRTGELPHTLSVP
jgi:hypothetical protein